MQVILQGSLRHFPSSELLQFLLNRGQSGTIDFENGGVRARLLFDKDRITWAESAGARDAFDAAVEVLGWSGGTFTVLDAAVLPEGAQPQSFELQSLRAEAQERAEVAALYPMNTTFRVVENPSAAQVSLTADELGLLFRLTTGRTLAQLAAEQPIPRRELALRLKRLEEIGLVTVTRGDSSPAATAPEPSRSAPPEPPPAAPEPARNVAPEAPRAAAQEPRPAAQAQAAPAPPPASAAAAPPVEPEPPAVLRPAASASEEDVATRIERFATLVGTLTPESPSDPVHPLLDAEQTVGRAANNAIVIPDGSVSSQHARLTRTAEGFFIEDLGSRNGTFVNGEKVSEKRRLADGDLIRIGKILMTFNIAQETHVPETTSGGMLIS